MRKVLIIGLLFLSAVSWGQNLYLKDSQGRVIYSQDKFAITKYYNKSALALFNRMSVKPSDIEKRIYSDAFDSLQHYGIFDSLDVFYAFGVHDKQAATLNWINNSHNATLINNTEFITYFGYKGNGASYINTNYNPATDGVKYKRDKAIFGIAIDSLGGANAYHGATEGTTVNTFLVPNLSGVFYSRLNTSVNTTIANSHANGLFAVRRDGSFNQESFLNKTKTISSVESKGVPNYNIFLLARNTNGTATDFSINNINCAFLGANLTDEQYYKLVDIINNFNNQMRLVNGVIGFHPNNTGGTNSYFLQRALNGGDTVIRVDIEGDYLISNSHYIYDSTTIIFSSNTALKKDDFVKNVFINEGALSKNYNYNIEIDGLNLKVNGYENCCNVPGLRGHLGFFYIKDLIIKNFSCYDIGTFQYCMQFGQWENIYMENITIEGNKDGLDFFAGHNAVLRDIYLKTRDDGVFLGGIGYPSSQLEVIGDVYDMTFININYTDSLDVLNARGIFSYLGSWADWLNGNLYKTGDFAVNQNNIYQVNNTNGFSANATAAPVHTSGTIIGADGISWHHIDTGTRYHTDIYNITIDSSFFYKTPNVIDYEIEDNEFMRTIYPGTETLAKGRNITIKNTTAISTGLIRQRTGLIDIHLENNNFDSLTHFVLNDGLSLPVGDSLYIISNNNTFSNCSTFIENNNRRIFFESDNENIINSSFINNTSGVGELRAINYTLPFNDKNEITPVLNDTCRFTDGLHYWNGSSWVLIP